MDKRTTSIILVILTSLLCGLPGLAGLCLGPLAILGSLLPDSDLPQADAQLALVTGLVISCLSVIFIAIPITTGFVTFRRRVETPSIIEGVIPDEDF